LLDDERMDEMTAWLRDLLERDLAKSRSDAEQLRPSVREGYVFAPLLEAENRVADCESKLAILAEHGGEHMCFENTHDGNTWGWYWGDCRVMRHVASGYRHRPGYREKWKP
jgi:Family of unknown function (DUF6221)